MRGRVSFDLHAGEILGLAGLVGAGRTSVLRELFGARPCGLEVSIAGKRIPIQTPRDAMRQGFAYVPEERASEGLILDMMVERNIALPSLRRFRLENELDIARPFMERFRIRGGGAARMLSGGNQQKVVLAKWMARAPKVLLLDEPTRGLDVRAKRDVHDVVRELAAAGKGRHRFELGGRGDRAALPPGHRARPREGSRGACPARTDGRQHTAVRHMNDISMPSNPPINVVSPASSGS